MKQLKQLFVKTLLLTIVISIGITAYAGASDEWINVYTQDFSDFSDSDLTNDNFPETKFGYTANVVDEALQIKSDNVCDWKIVDDAYPGAADNNSNGIKLTNGAANGSLKKEDPPFEAAGVLYDYTGASTTAWAMENMGGRNALRILSFPQDKLVNGAWDYRTSEYRFSIDEGRFDLSRTSYDIEIDLYFPQGKKPSFVRFTYTKGATSTSYAELKGAALSAMPTDEWVTWKFSVDNAYFGKIGTVYGSVKLNFIITQAGYAYSKTATTYIGRVGISPKVTGEYLYTPLEKAIKFPLGIDDVFGNTRVKFDLSLPSTERYSGFTMYNNGKNSARVALSNENNDEIAAVQIDSTDDGQSIYALTGSNGVEEKELLYEGEILEKMLTYQFDVDWKAKTYTIIIKDGNELLSEYDPVYGPYSILNSDKVPGNVLVRGFSIKHNAASEMMATLLDNISVEYCEDPDYVNCKADAENLELELPEGGIITEDMDLPTTGEPNNSAITWESSNTEIITISQSGDKGLVSRGAIRENVTLTATLDINGVKVLKSFKVTVEKSEDQYKVEDDAATVTLDVPASGIVVADFDLPTEGTVNGTLITWESSDTSAITISPSGDKALLSRGSSKIKVTLTATANLNGYTSTKDFDVIVCEHEDFLKARADVEAILLNIPETCRVKDNFDLPNAGTINSSVISWTTSDEETIAVSGNTAVVTRFDTNKDVTLTASATLNGFTATREFKLVSTTLRGVSAEINEVQEVISGGTLSASVNIDFPGKEGTLNFIAMVIDPATGEILDRRMDTKTLTTANRYSTINCSVSGLAYAPGNETKYYIWNEKRESFVNNAPSAVTELTAEGRGKGVRLNWEASVDDNSSVEYYAVYRDGEYIGTAVEETYLDETAEVGAVYDYEVRGVDTNDMYSTGLISECTPALGMYYYNFDKQGKGEENYKHGLEYTRSTSGDAYSWITLVVDANGEESYAATSSNKWVIGKTDKSCINGDVRDMIFEVVYLDTSGSIKMVHNQVIPQGLSDNLTYARKNVTPISGMQGTYQWKTAVFAISNANFRESGYWSGSDFGFTASVNDKMFIKEIRVIQAGLYN